MSLAKVVLPLEILDKFDIVNVVSKGSEIHIYLDEEMNTSLHSDLHFKSKGYTYVTNITDFPICDHKVLLKFRRRRWEDIRSGNSFVLPLKIAADGTRYSKEFASFLKETYGYFPSDLPYT